MAEIPTELITKILVYLPVKSLLRFRSASKSTCSLIDSIELNQHQITSSEKMIYRKMIFQDRSCRFHICDMNEHDKECGPPPSLVQNQAYGYCNGLLLLFGNSPNAALWNPSTCQSWNLPSSPPTAGFHQIIGSGLGFDSSTCEYKVVLILYTQPNHVQVCVFGVISNAWRRVGDFPFETKMVGRGFTSKPSIGYFADGGLHWLTSWILGNNSQQEILTFDLEKETFSLVPLPVCLTRTDRVLMGLHVLDRSLCVSFYYSCKPLQADLYKRERDGSWTQLYSIKQPIILEIFQFRSVRVLGYSKSRKEILLDFGMEDSVAMLRGQLLEKMKQRGVPFGTIQFFVPKAFVACNSQSKQLPCKCK